MLRLAADENFNNTILRVPRQVPVGQVIEDIVLLIEASLEGEWEGQVRYLPLR